MERIIKAPIDEKNVTSNWIEEVFDQSVMIDNVCTGFIRDCLVTCKYEDNNLYWEVETMFFNIGKDADAAFTELKKRLKTFADDEGYLIERTHIYERKKCLVQQFFFRQD